MGGDQDVCRQTAVNRIVHAVEVTIAIVLAIFPEIVNRRSSTSAAGLGEISWVVVLIVVDTTLMLLSHANRFPPATGLL